MVCGCVVLGRECTQDVFRLCAAQNVARFANCTISGYNCLCSGSEAQCSFQFGRGCAVLCCFGLCFFSHACFVLCCDMLWLTDQIAVRALLSRAKTVVSALISSLIIDAFARAALTVSTAPIVCAVLCCAVLCCAVLCCAVLCACTALCYALYSLLVWCCLCCS